MRVSISRLIWAGLVLTAAMLCGCSSPQNGTASTAPTPATQRVVPTELAEPTSPRTPGPVDEASITAEQAAVEAVFHGYYGALLARDFVTACALVAPEAVDRLLEQLAAQGTPADTCEAALGIVLARPEAAEYTDEIARTAQAHDIRVQRDDATITWSATVRGQTATATNVLRRIDGSWRLVDAR